MKLYVRIVLASLIPRLLSSQAATPPVTRLQEYAVDAGHSIVEFSIGFAFSRVKGRFTHSKGTILYDSIAPANSSVSIVIESKSLDTGWPHRDEHLRTSDFFDVEKYPTIVFQSERMTRAPKGWIADGKLSMHGVTRQVSIPFRLTQQPTRSAESNWMILNAEGALRLARGDFNIFGGSTFNSWFNKARAATMADSVDISIEIEGWRADAKSQRTTGVEAALERVRVNGVQSQIDRLAELKKTRKPDEFGGIITGGDFVSLALIATGRIDDAVKMSRAMIELFPQEPRVFMVHGLALAMSGDNRGAAQQYAKAKQVFRPPVIDPNEKFPQDDENWYYLDQLARTVVEWGHAAKAVPVALAVAEMYPQNARAHATLGLTLAASGDARGATAAYAKALEVNPIETRALELRRRIR